MFDDSLSDLSRTPSPLPDPLPPLDSSMSSPSATATKSVSVTNPATSAAEASGTPSNHTGYPQPYHFSPGASAVPGIFSGYSPVSSESVNLLGYKTPPQSLPMNFGALPMSNDTSNSFMSPPFIPPSMPLSVQSQFSPPGVQQVHN